MSRLAMCPDCHNPLVSTMAYAGYEFYCLNCGSHYGFLSPYGADETPARLKRYEGMRSIWKLIGSSLIPNCSYRQGDCKLCETDDNHKNHLTDEEKKKHEEAAKALENIKGLFGGRRKINEN